MKNKLKYLILAAVLIFILVAAGLLYDRLTAEYTPNDFAPGDTVDTGIEGNESADPDRIEAPDFTVLDADGEEVKLSDSFGKPIILNFWATWCGPCRSELPHFDKAAAEFGDEIDFLMINLTDGAQETVEGVTEFLNENGYTFPTYYDTELMAAAIYGASSIPLTVFIDTEGRLIGGYIGAMTEEMLYQCIDQFYDLD